MAEAERIGPVGEKLVTEGSECAQEMEMQGTWSSLHPAGQASLRLERGDTWNSML